MDATHAPTAAQAISARHAASIVSAFIGADAFTALPAPSTLPARSAAAGPSSSSGATETAVVGSFPSIVAVFQPHRLIGDRRVNSGDAQHIDVTDLVLLQKATALRQLRDDHGSTDALVPYDRHGHNGLYRVELVKSICSHFGVASLAEITQPMVDTSCIQHTRMRLAERAKELLGMDPIRTLESRQQAGDINPFVRQARSRSGGFTKHSLSA